VYNPDTDLLFPPRLIPDLQDLRGDEWRALVMHIQQVPLDDVGRLAFVLLMVRLGGCTSCQADSYRAMQGCTQCALQTVKRYRGDDADLRKLFDEAKSDVAQFLEK
jgi:hypothetical protein